MCLWLLAVCLGVSRLLVASDPSPSGRTWLSSHISFKLAGAAPTERGVPPVSGKMTLCKHG